MLYYNAVRYWVNIFSYLRNFIALRRFVRILNKRPRNRSVVRIRHGRPFSFLFQERGPFEFQSRPASSTRPVDFWNFYRRAEISFKMFYSYINYRIGRNLKRYFSTLPDYARNLLFRRRILYFLNSKKAKKSVIPDGSTNRILYNNCCNSHLNNLDFFFNDINLLNSLLNLWTELYKVVTRQIITSPEDSGRASCR